MRRHFITRKIKVACAQGVDLDANVDENVKNSRDWRLPPNLNEEEDHHISSLTLLDFVYLLKPELCLVVRDQVQNSNSPLSKVL